MKTVDVMQAFLDYFEANDHTVVASAPLVPDDPSLLFTNAGMVQFKDYFLGLESRPYTRATSVQKCMRVTGKHNDLENVGPSPRHHTFFQMLGNFSFGDYFKAEAIRYGWEFMADRMGLPPERLVVTVYRDDEEALQAWTQDVGFDAERVLRMGEKTNFWMMADVGPCGPTTEIHYDFGPEHCTCQRPDCSVALDNDCGRWLEVWNIVFMQFEEQPDGQRVPLPKTGVDTGMGLERLSAIKQGVHSTYDTDQFAPIFDRVQQLAEHTEEERLEHLHGYRVLADHGRAAAFLVADGVLPGNEGRNYVLRLIMRRAMRFGKLVGFREPFMTEIVRVVVETMADPYPELHRKADWIGDVVGEEEARFERTLDSGMQMLDELIAATTAAGESQLAGREVFRLYDTFGFPPDLTETVAEEHELTIDRQGFEAAMGEQRERARAGGTFGDEGERQAYRKLSLPETEFVGYEQLSSEAELIALRFAGESVSVVGDAVANEAADAAAATSAVEAVLSRTPFYAEAGGQVADTGVLRGPSGVLIVEEASAPVPGVVVHRGHLESGSMAVGDTVTALVDEERRLDIMRNHTVTHLLHHALQEVLGEHAQQRGSLVAPDRVRFDFSHLKALTPEELAEVQRLVNCWIREDAPVDWCYVTLEEAKREGAMMLFGEKYADEVRMVTVEGISRELCGGTHLNRTGQIGLFLITQETSVGAGLRRIEGLTGRGAERLVAEREELLTRLAEQVGAATTETIETRVAELQGRVHRMRHDLERLEASLAAAQAVGSVGDRTDVDGVPVLTARVEARDMESLRTQADAFRDQLGSGVVVIGAVIEDAPRLVSVVTEDLVGKGYDAGDLVRRVAALIGGGGGGRPHLAEAGGQDAGALEPALAAVPDLVREMVTGDED